AITHLDASAYWLGEKVVRFIRLAYNRDSYLKRFILKLCGWFDKLFESRITRGVAPNQQNAQDDRVNGQLQQPDPQAGSPSLWSRMVYRVSAWMALFFGLFWNLVAKLKPSTSDLDD